MYVDAQFSCSVYLSVVFKELLTVNVPYSNLKNDLQVAMAIINGHKPRIPWPLGGKESALLWMICYNCWLGNPHDRPTMHRINAVLLRAKIYRQFGSTVIAGLPSTSRFPTWLTFTSNFDFSSREHLLQEVQQQDESQRTGTSFGLLFYDLTMISSTSSSEFVWGIESFRSV